MRYLRRRITRPTWPRPCHTAACCYEESRLIVSEVDHPIGADAANNRALPAFVLLNKQTSPAFLSLTLGRCHTKRGLLQ